MNLEDEILAYIKGVNKPRENPLTKAQIVKHFPMYAETLVDQILVNLLFKGLVTLNRKSLSSTRRHNGAYVYEYVAKE